MSELGHEVQLAPPPKVDDETALLDATTQFSPELIAEIESEIGTLIPDLNERLTPTVQALIARCMDGTEPMLRSLRPWEPPKLSGLHVTALLMASAGFRGNFISDALNINRSRVSVIMRHPYGRKILRALFAQSGSMLLDMKSKLESYAHDLIDKVYDEAQKSSDLVTVAKVSFGMLDRAGYAPRTAAAVAPSSTTVNVVVDQRDRLADALAESRQVDAMVMPTRKPSLPPSEATPMPQLKAVG